MVYIDTSALVPMVVPETGSPAVLAWLAGHADAVPVISTWTRAELVSAISGKVRLKVIREAEARRTLADARRELLPRLRLERLQADDVEAAEALLERFELSLRAGDALHLAIVRRLGEPLLTLDRRMAAAAEALGTAVAVPA